MEDFQVISDILFKYKEQFDDKDFLEINNRLKKIHDKNKNFNNFASRIRSSSIDNVTSSDSESENESIPVRSTPYRYQGGTLILPRQVITDCFRNFILNNWQILMDSSNNPILSEVQYDSDGNILINMRDSLKLVTSYVKKNHLRNNEDPRKIRMDQTLKELFPDYTEKRDENGTIIKEENFGFFHITPGIRMHLTN